MILKLKIEIYKINYSKIYEKLNNKLIISCMDYGQYLLQYTGDLWKTISCRSGRGLPRF